MYNSVGSYDFNLEFYKILSRMNLSQKLKKYCTKNDNIPICWYLRTFIN